MAHEFDTGFTVRQPAWHGLGNVLDAQPENWDDARMAAGLMWEPAYEDLYVPRVVPLGTELPEGAVATAKPMGNVDGLAQTVMVPVGGHRAIIRDDTREVLATPTDTFELIYHHQMGELLEAYTETWRKAGANVRFETAGSLAGGRRVWALVMLDEPYTVPGDESQTYPYAALINAHDGSGACKLMPTQVRIVCQNTFNAASLMGDRDGHQVVIRHAGNVEGRVEQAKVALGAMRDEAKEWQVLATDLAGINVDDALIQTFLDQFIPIPEAASERTKTDRLERQLTFKALHDTSPTTDAIRGTAYGLFQAAGEYLDHIRPFRSQDTYLTRTMLKPEPVKAASLRLIRELVSAN